MNREYKLTYLFSFFTLIILIVLSAILLLWTYGTTNSVLIDEIGLSFEQRIRTAQNIINEESRFIQDFAVILNQSDSLAGNLLSRDYEAVSQEVSVIKSELDEVPDILFITGFDKRDTVDFSAPIFPLMNFSGFITGNTDQLIKSGRILESAENDEAVFFLIKATEIVQRRNGRVAGYIYTGTVLNNNFSLLSRIRRETGVDIVTLSAGEKLIATTDQRDSLFTKTVSSSYDPEYPGRLSQVSVHRQGYLASSANIYLDRRETPLITLAIKSTPLNVLKNDYLKKAIIITLLVLFFITASVFLIARLTSEPLADLVNYAKEVEREDKPIRFRAGQIREFNEVGLKMESMVKKIKSAEERFRQFADAAWEAIVIHKNGVLIEANDQFYKMFGFDKEIDRETLTGKNIIENLYKGKSYDIVQNRIKQNIEDSYEVIANKKDGSEIVVEIRIRNMTYHNETVRVAAIQDVTERKRMASLMVQTEKMMSVGGLAAGMAHEINNPLAGMIQTANVLSRRLTGNSKIKANREAAQSLGTDLETIGKYMEQRKIIPMLGIIEESGKRIAQIVENMLSFARKSSDEVSSHNINEILDKTIKLAETDYNLKSRYDFKSIDIITEYEKDLPLIPCEENMIQQVFLNIMQNGSQAMHKAGTPDPRLIIRTKFLEEESSLQIEVEDNGPGMDEKTKKRIFEPFFTTKPVGEGTGLGLSVSYFIVKENHNGELNVHSKPGSGTIFEIIIPVSHK